MGETETLKEISGELAVIREALERAEISERMLTGIHRELEAERDQLRAEVARLRAQERDDISKCVRVGHKCRIENAEQTHSVEWMLGRLEDKCADWASSYSVLYSRANAATARAESAEGRAAGLYRALCDAVRASGGVANDGISDTFLIIGVPAEMAARKKAQEAAERERDETLAHAADLRGALEEIVHTHETAKQMEVEADAALLLTPAQSLGRLKAGALRELKNMAARKVDGCYVVFWNHIEAEADRLEATNATN